MRTYLNDQSQSADMLDIEKQVNATQTQGISQQQIPIQLRGVAPLPLEPSRTPRP